MHHIKVRSVKTRQLEKVATVILLFSCVLFVVHNFIASVSTDIVKVQGDPRNEVQDYILPAVGGTGNGEFQCSCDCRCNGGRDKQTIYVGNQQKSDQSSFKTDFPEKLKHQESWHQQAVGQDGGPHPAEERNMVAEEVQAMLHQDTKASENESQIQHNDIRQDLYSQLKEFTFVAPKRDIPPAAEFEDRQPRMVIILAYQRSGSTFLGASLFNDNPNAYYVYEPLDALYTSMYGVSPGWTVPSEITSYRENGTLRLPPLREAQAVSWYLDKMLSCSVSSLPYEAYVHKFWRDHSASMRAMKPYLSCLQKVQMLGETCHVHVEALCGSRFGQRDNMFNQEACADFLWEKKTPLQEYQRKMFEDYDKCTSDHIPRLTECVPILRGACERQKLRALKTVRGTMASMEELLVKHKNLRIIHLYRDPRSVVLSRQRLVWPLGNYERVHPGPESVARVYCQTVLQDYRTRLRLEEQFPGKIMEVVYDNYIKDPVAGATDIYEFIGAVLPKELITKLKHLKKTKWIESPIAIMGKYLVSNDIDKIQNECKEFAKELGIKWSET